MVSRRDFGASDIARQNASVWIAVGVWSSRLLLLTALPCFLVATTLGVHDHVVVTPSLFVHHLGSGYAGGSLRHLIVTLTVTFLCVTLESLLLCRDAFARGEPSAMAALLATARRVLFDARHAAMPVVGSLAPRRAGVKNENDDHSILRQLRRALSISPLAPPRLVALGSDLFGPFCQSSHRVEVGVAA